MLSNHKYPDSVHQLALEWGWASPPADILELASTSLRWKDMKAGEIVVELGLMSAVQRDSLLTKIPDKRKSLEWFAQNDPKVRQHIERIITMKKGRPFYDDLHEMQEHSALVEPNVAKRCNELDAALMVIEGVRPALIFSSYDGLFSFMTAGQEDRSKCAIRAATKKDELFLAVSRREEVAVVIGGAAASGGASGAGDGESNSIWLGSLSESQEQKEMSRIIDSAIANGATDISLKPFRDGRLQVLMRRYGDLVKSPVRDVLDSETAAAIVRFLATKSGANPSSSRMREPADGQITYRSVAGDVFLRLSFIPLIHPGERRDLISVSCRLLPRVEKSISVEDLKIAPHVRDQLDLALRLGKGFILIAGPTNSGKSTTIGGAIGMHVSLFGDTRKRLSVEDPIERFYFGVTQVNVRQRSQSELKNVEDDNRFVPVLRAFKRHDPDMIVVGEIRDRATAEISVSSATSGHLVLSTIHANDSIMAIDVLARMVDPAMAFQLVESLSLIASQRLVKTLCKCKKSRPTTEDDRRVWRHYCESAGETHELPDELWEPVGCDRDECQDGYDQIVPIIELLPFTRQVKDLAGRLLTDHTAREDLQKQLRTTLLGEGHRLLSNGTTDLSSVLV